MTEWERERAPYSVYNLNLISLIALKCQVTGSLISTLFPKLLIKIRETITFHRVEKCGADNVFFSSGFLPHLIILVCEYVCVL